VGIALVSAHFADAGPHPIRGLASMTYTDPRGPESMAHSHNDFAQSRPLDTALENGITSIEVDVTDRHDEVSIVHLGFWTYGTLKEMYLDRLQRLVDEKGSVYGDGQKVTLWIELRPFITTAAVVPMLRALLDRYPMFAVFGKSGKVIHPGPVEAVIINDRSRDFFVGRSSAPACLGTTLVEFKEGPNEDFECWVHLRWGRYFNWQGGGEITKKELAKLKTIQAAAHARGLKTRFWASPDTPLFWARARSLPFDLVNTDNLHSTMEILRGAR
jgi:hypothetical protein